MTQAKTAAEARSYAQWVKLTGPADEAEFNHDGTSFKVVAVKGSHHVDDHGHSVWVRRLGILSGVGGESVFAYDSHGNLARLWGSSQPRPEWVDEIVNV